MAIIQPSKGSAIQALKYGTIRDFNGLWDPTQTPLNLPVTYQSILTNLLPDTRGCPTIRPGYEEFHDIDKKQTEFTVILRAIPSSNRMRAVFPGYMHNMVIGLRVTISNIPSGVYLNRTHTQLMGTYQIWNRINDTQIEVLVDDWFGGSAEEYITITATGTLAAEKPLGNIIDCEYFIDKIVAVTDKGYVFTVDDQNNQRVVWSPTIANTYSYVTDVGVNAATDAGSNIISLYIPLAEGKIEVGDFIKLTNYGTIGGIPDTEINQPFRVIQKVAGDVYGVRARTVASSNANSSAGTAQWSIDRGWHDCESVTHTIFNRQMLFFNGADKPIRYDINPIENDAPCAYLVDPVTGSNLNTPVSQYVASGSGFVAAAGFIDDPGKLVIASQGTTGVWPGDVAPNNATSVNLSRVVNVSTPDVTGLAFYQGLLFATFDNAVVIYKLGKFQEDLHLPELVTVVDQYGSLSHKGNLSLNESFFMLDQSGVIDVRRNQQASSTSDNFTPKRTSERITAHLTASLTGLTRQERQKIWTLYDRKEGREYLFIPNGSQWLTYVFVRQLQRRIEGWALIRGWNFRCGCRSSADRLFTCIGRKIYRIGNIHEPVYTDNGAAIQWVMETPWLELSARMMFKRSRRIMLDTEGYSEFTLKTFTDYQYEDYTVSRDIIEQGGTVPVYNEFTRPLKPSHTMQFIAGDSPGYGRGVQPYGGGRRTNEPLTYVWPTRFKIAKLRLEGSAREPFALVGISVGYMTGNL